MPKNYFLLACIIYLFLGISSKAQTTAISNPGYDDVLDGYVLTSNILSITDMKFPYDGNPGYINGILCPSPDLESWGDLSGLEHFISLEIFYAGGFYDETLDWSSLINLKELTIDEAWGLKKLILSNSLDLKQLSIRGAEYLTELDLSNNIKLEKIDISIFEHPVGLTSLDLSKNTALKELSLATFELTRLNLKNGNNKNNCRHGYQRKYLRCRPPA